MNRKLLFLGVILSGVAMVSTAAILLLTDASADNVSAYSNFQIALQINLFHAIVLFFLAQAKRKYNDQNLVIAGYIFVVGTLLLALPAYVGLLIHNEIMFELTSVFGLMGLIIGWILLTKSFYDIYFAKRR